MLFHVCIMWLFRTHKRALTIHYVCMFTYLWEKYISVEVVHFSYVALCIYAANYDKQILMCTYFWGKYFSMLWTPKGFMGFMIWSWERERADWYVSASTTICNFNERLYPWDMCFWYLTTHMPLSWLFRPLVLLANEVFKSPQNLINFETIASQILVSTKRECSFAFFTTIIGIIKITSHQLTWWHLGWAPIHVLCSLAIVL